MFLSLPLKILLIKDEPFTQLPKRRKEKRKHDSSTLQMGWLPERRLLEKGPGTRNFPEEKLRPRLSTHTPPQGPHDGLTWQGRHPGNGALYAAHHVDHSRLQVSVLRLSRVALTLHCLDSGQPTWAWPTFYWTFVSSMCLHGVFQPVSPFSLLFSNSAFLTFDEGNGHLLSSWNFQITFENCQFTERLWFSVRAQRS